MRIIACKAWYAGDRTWQADFPTTADLVEWWRGLPDDGALAFRLWFNKMAPVRLGRFVSGSEWYFLLDAPDTSIDGYRDDLDELMARYPNAIPKRGKLVGEREIARVNREMSAAAYWGDA
jgi:hypothetical protein